jgi:8-oxo-dGTP pyrophosphatase MutT (NUDIX family)
VSEEMHPIQVEMLKKLLFSPTMKYSELRIHDDMENNTLNFHIKQLQTMELIIHADNAYTLTAKGKEFAGRIDTDALHVMRQAKLGVWVCCTRIVNDIQEYLMFTRLKQPFYGCQGFMSGKIAYGETVQETAKRELFEETGLTGTPMLVAIKHYRVFDAERQTLLEDKIMFFHQVSNPTGTLASNEEGKHEWVKETDVVAYVHKPFETVEVLQKQLDLIRHFNGNIQFIEEDHHTQNF